MSDRTPSQLGLHLQMTRGLQWHFGTTGDPYALILRAQADDPTPFHAMVRERGVLHQSLLGAFVTADPDLGRTILTDPRLGLRKADGEPPVPQVLPLDETFLGLGAAGHARITERAANLLSEQAVHIHEPHVRRLAESRISKQDSRFDLVTDFAAPLAVDLTADLLGIPDADRAHFASLCADLRPTLDSLVCPQPLGPTRALLAALANVTKLLSDMGCTVPEARHAAVITATAGVEIGTTLLVNAVHALLARPEQWAKLVGDPGLAADAVTETLRFDAPVQLHTRVALADTEFAGIEIPKDSQLVVLAGAAGRDPGLYADADEFELTRVPGPAPLSFTGGFHCGLLAPLLRVQAETALRVLAEHAPKLRQTGKLLRRRRSPVLRGPLSLPVTA
ncbi:P450-derived glycosyltransferase activator [Crossiella sp. CA-258035]|uniref:cytochrome P450 family protein n=1 Tax=Crossiella sp. CA-258035 TaxID=2981138 RepID=UPI0024BCA3F0|nr:P450-derived glycosyltransferase activator [Crossiella sp. CA-258035]WHT21631.1 P450-derived glycosyltransferase activator [Crossiella sp. CA-258035]